MINKKKDHVIEPTYTDLYWKANMNQIQKETLDMCQKMTQDMIEEATKKHEQTITEMLIEKEKRMMNDGTR